MSNISTRSSVLKYVSGETSALSGQQLVIAHYKTDKETGIKPDSKAVSLPVVTKEAVIESIDSLMSGIQKLIYDSRVEMFKEMLEAKADLQEVEQSELDLGAIATWLNATVKSERISKASIEAWFDEVASSYLSVAIASKLGITATTPETSELYLTLAQTLDSYKASFAKLAGISVNLSSDAINAIKRALSFIEVNDSTKQYLVNKIDRITNAPKADLLAL